MSLETFWAAVEAARSEGEFACSQLEAYLAVRPPGEILEFQHDLDGLMARSYRWDLWGAAYLINGGCSDDGFDYFRGWLITQGREVFEAALANPDSLADVPGLDEDEVECEEILGVAFHAYQQATGGEMPPAPVTLPDLGEDWDFDDDEAMQSRCPKLFAMFG